MKADQDIEPSPKVIFCGVFWVLLRKGVWTTQFSAHKGNAHDRGIDKDKHAPSKREIPACDAKQSYVEESVKTNIFWDSR